MLWSLAVIFAVLWVLGLITSYTFGGVIHILIFAALAMVLLRIIRGSGHRTDHGHPTGG